MSQYFIDDKNVSDAGDYAHIMPLAFLTFGNINIEDSPRLAGDRLARLMLLADGWPTDVTAQALQFFWLIGISEDSCMEGETGSVG